MRFVVFCALAGCMDFTQPTYVQPTIDPIAGRVISTFPRDGESDVVNEGDITIFFSVPMNTASVVLTTDPPITFAPATWDQGDQRVHLRIVGALQDGTLYTATIDGNDSDGVAVLTHSFSFATSTPIVLTQPQVTGLEPETGVAIQQAITVSFSKPIDTATIAFNPEAVLTEAWNTERTAVTITPSAGWLPTQSYLVTIEAVDTEGLSVSASLSFTTLTPQDLTPPTIVSRSPLPAATNVPTSASVSLSFSEPMQPGTLAIGLTTPSGATLPCTSSVAPNNMGITCAPATQLPGTTVITATVSAGALDVAGNALSDTLTYTFTTGSTPDTIAPTITTNDPATGSNGVANTQSLTFVFSEAMDQSATAAALTVMRGAQVVPGNVSWSGTRMTFDPTSNFFFGDAVTWSFSTNARDLSGNPLAGTKSGNYLVIRYATVMMRSSATLDAEIFEQGQAAVDPLVRAGDYYDDMADEIRTMRAYFTFNLAELTAGLGTIDESRLNIVSATFAVTLTDCSGSPAVLAPLLAEGIVYGPSAGGDDFGCMDAACQMQGFTYDQFAPATYAPGAKVFARAGSNNVANKVAADWANRVAQQKRSQWRIRFTALDDGDHDPDDCTFRSGASAIVNERPRLTVSFEYP